MKGWDFAHKFASKPTWNPLQTRHQGSKTLLEKISQPEQQSHRHHQASRFYSILQTIRWIMLALELLRATHASGEESRSKQVVDLKQQRENWVWVLCTAHASAFESTFKRLCRNSCNQVARLEQQVQKKLNTGFRVKSDMNRREIHLERTAPATVQSTRHQSVKISKGTS